MLFILVLNNLILQEDSENEAPVNDDADDGAVSDQEEKAVSAVLMALQSYKEALATNDEPKIIEIESFLLSIEDEKNSLANKIAMLTQELSLERDRILRISADFDNFRKRTEREKLSLMTNVQGEVIESLLPVLDNFERAKAQIKVETEGEEEINNSYQSIYKQFIEILTSLGVENVETVGHSFDPSVSCCISTVILYAAAFRYLVKKTKFMIDTFFCFLLLSSCSLRSLYLYAILFPLKLSLLFCKAPRGNNARGIS